MAQTQLSCFVEPDATIESWDASNNPNHDHSAALRLSDEANHGLRAARCVSSQAF